MNWKRFWRRAKHRRKSECYGELVTIFRLPGWLCGLFYPTACAVCDVFLCIARSCNAVSKDSLFEPDLCKGNVMGIVFNHSILRKNEAVL